MQSLLKYISIFPLLFQQEYYYKITFFMDRFKSLVILFTLFSFFSAIFLSVKGTLYNFSISQILTYVLGIHILRAIILADGTWNVIRDINLGRISSYLIRPISYIGFCMVRDISKKIIQGGSAIFEVCLIVFFLHIPLETPSLTIGLLVCLNIVLSSILYFLMIYSVSSLAFWTSESAGPRFCFELFVQFASGSIFPLAFFPEKVRGFFEILPFSYLIHFPLNIYLGEFTYQEIFRIFSYELIWIIVMWFICQYLWHQGLKNYSSDGA